MPAFGGLVPTNLMMDRWHTQVYSGTTGIGSDITASSGTSSPPVSFITYDELFPNRPDPGSLDYGVSLSWVTIADIRWGMQGLNGGIEGSSYTAVPFSASPNGSFLRDIGTQHSQWTRPLQSLRSNSEITGNYGNTLAVTFPAGFPNGFSPILLVSLSSSSAPAYGLSYSSVSGVQSLYVAHWIKIPSNYSLQGSSGYKGIQANQTPATGAAPPRHDLNAWYPASGVGGAKMSFAGVEENPFFLWKGPAASSRTINDGTWHLQESIWIAPSSYTNSTATILQYTDGVLEFSTTTGRMFNSDQSGYLNEWVIRAAIAGGSGVSSTATWELGPVLIMGAKGSNTNEPAGFLPIYRNTFSGTGNQPSLGRSTNWVYNSVTTVVSGITGADGQVFRGTWPNGLAAGAGGMTTRMWDTDPDGSHTTAIKCRKVYHRFRFMLPGGGASGTDFQVGTVNTKLFYWGYGRIVNDNDGTITLEGNYENISPATTFPIHVSLSLGDAFGLPVGDYKPAANFVQNVSGETNSRRVKVNTWQVIESLLDLGTVDGVNGSINAWVDGVKVISYNSLRLRDSSDNTTGDPQTSTYGIFNMSWAPIFTSSLSKNRDDSIYIDEVYISGELDPTSPGPGGVNLNIDSLSSIGTLNSTAYLATGVRTLSAGSAYADPATGVRIIKSTSSVYPEASPYHNFHAYSEGANNISCDLGNGLHTIVTNNWGGNSYLLNVQRGGGVSNPRFAPGDTFSFSNSTAEPHIGYVISNSSVRRYNTLTASYEDTGNFPYRGVVASTNPSGRWFTHDRNQDYFCWIESSTTVRCWRASTNTTVARSFANLDEPYLSLDGRYILIGASTPVVWDVDTNSVTTLTMRTNHGIGHVPSMRSYFLTANTVTGAGITPMDYIPAADPTSDAPATDCNGYLGQWHRSCWPQASADTSQLFILSCFDDPVGDHGASIGIYGTGYHKIDNSGYQRLLFHSYARWYGITDTAQDYLYYTGMAKAQPSPDGKMVIFTSNMWDSRRGDVFVAEVPLI